MKLNLEARRTVADALERYVSGSIDNYTLDDLLVQCGKSDTACLVLRREIVDILYDLSSRHKHEGKWKLTATQERMVHRWILFLRTAENWPSTEFTRTWSLAGIPHYLYRFVSGSSIFDNEHWPYKTFGDWEHLYKGDQRQRGRNSH